ncbi:MAG: hypothetical protein LQ340_002521 [Diploschistes diacapsis]|nr:MAG: hypothetical protein LQ340_002521 [Diploschistes diacapsis]
MISDAKKSFVSGEISNPDQLDALVPGGQSRKDQTRSSRFQNLPRETLQNIAELLPISSAAALTLTCKSLLFILGHRYLHYLRRGDYCNEPELRKLLLLIERDLPTYYGCLDCLRLHSFYYTVPRGRRVLQHLQSPILGDRLCKEMDYTAQAALFSGKPIRFENLNKVMRQHRTGTLRPAALLRLSSLKSKSTKDPSLERLIRFRIASNELLMKGVYRFTVDLDKRYDLLTNKTLEKLYICSHFSFKVEPCTAPTTVPQGLFMHLQRLKACKCCRNLWNKVRCKSFGAKSAPGETCSSLHSCDRCPTEFQIRAVRQGMSTMGIIITRWVNLGGIESPNSPKYRSLMHRRNERWENGGYVPLVQWQPGTIKAAFGN